MFRAVSFRLLGGTLVLTACAVAPPIGPAVVALPNEGKDLGQFQREDAACRGYAEQQIGSASSQQTANQNAIGSTAAGTAAGAAAGAIVGAAAGAAGIGAAVGAGTGLLLGSSVAAAGASSSAAMLQQHYDIDYAQCMTANGNSVAFPLMAYQAYGYANGYYAPWISPALSFGFFGVFGHNFHHHHHPAFHHGSHRG
jgi:hypothetical protein